MRLPELTNRRIFFLFLFLLGIVIPVIFLLVQKQTENKKEILENEKLKKFDFLMKEQRKKLEEKRKLAKLKAERKRIEEEIAEFDRINRRQRLKLMEEQKIKDQTKPSKEDKQNKMLELKEAKKFIFKRKKLPENYPKAPFEQNLKVYFNKLLSLLPATKQEKIQKAMEKEDKKKFIFFAIDEMLKLIPEETKQEELFDFTALEYGRKYGITVWGMDYHIATMGDTTDLFHSLGLNITVIDKSLSNHCHLMKSCATDLKWKNPPSGQTAATAEQLKSFFEAYRFDPIMKEVDIFINFYQAAAIRLYMPFHKPMWQICAVRYELGMHHPDAWNYFNKQLRAIAKDEKNLIGGNNMWDSVYLNYFTGLPIKNFESYCGYTKLQYEYPTKRLEILVGPSRLKQPYLYPLLRSSYQWQDYVVKPIRTLYPRYKFRDLLNHPAIIVLPYTISLMSIFEYYRMGFPMLFPSKKFMVELDFELNIAKEITWFRTFTHKRSTNSVIGRDKCSKIKYDPNAEMSRESMEYWWQYADFYQFPHISYFDSWDEIPMVLKKMDFKKISDDMKAHNKKVLHDLKKKWLHQFNLSLKGQKGKKDVPTNYEEAMKKYDLNYSYC